MNWSYILLTMNWRSILLLINFLLLLWNFSAYRVYRANTDAMLTAYESANYTATQSLHAFKRFADARIDEAMFYCRGF